MVTVARLESKNSKTQEHNSGRVVRNLEPKNKSKTRLLKGNKYLTQKFKNSAKKISDSQESVQSSAIRDLFRN